MGAGAQATGTDDSRMPELAQRMRAVSCRSGAFLRTRTGRPTHHVGVLRRPKLAGPAHGASLGLYAAKPRRDHARGGARADTSGACAVQTARAARHAYRRREARTSA